MATALKCKIRNTRSSTKSRRSAGFCNKEIKRKKGGMIWQAFIVYNVRRDSGTDRTTIFIGASDELSHDKAGNAVVLGR